MFVVTARKIDELGRIVLPKELRDEYALKCGEEIDICIDNGNIVLRKSEEHCVICNNTDSLTKINGKSICNLCRIVIKDN